MKTFKRIIASVMVAVMVLTAAPLSGFVGLELPDFGALFSMKAEAEEMTEYVDGVFKYSVSNGGAIITGTVYEADFIKTYFGSIEIPSVIGGYPVVEIGHLAFKDFELATALTIPYGVKKIAQGAFYNWKHLRVLELPDSITYIDDMAFGNCSALEILHLPSNLVSLQAGAFKSTDSLKEVVVPKSLIESSFDMCVVGIGMGTVSPFSDSGLTKITFETGRKEIPLGLFNNCNKLTEVYIPDSVEIIGQAAFRDCYSLEKVTGMKNIREICELAFSNCSSLKDVPFLSNLEKLGSGAFYNASSLDEFCVPQSLTDCGIHYSVIGVGMKSRIGPFENSGLIEVSFEEGTDSVPDCIFKGCRRLQTVEIPDNITKIGVASFWECDALLKISGMKNVQEIGDLAFCDCSSLTRIQLPVSLSFLGAGSFAKTISLQTITIPNTLDEVNTYYSYVGIGSGKLYAFDESGLTAVFFQAGLKSIPDYLLSNNSKLKSVDIPKSIKDVGEGAFENCDFLSDVYYYGSEGDWTSVIIDDNNIALSTATIHYLDMEVTEETEYVEGIFTYIIEDGAVTIIGCDKSASGYIAIPSTIRGYKVNKIGANAFSDCYDITSIDMPDSVTTIEDGAFLNCTNITSIKFSNSLEEIPRRAFFNCGKLKEAYIPDSVKTIGNDAFVYCGSLKVLSLGDNLVNIGMSAFSDCDSLVTVEIGIGLEKVAIGAFYSCDSLSDVYYAGSRVQWENISFRDLNSDLLNATIHYNSSLPESIVSNSIFSGISTEYNHELARFCVDFSLYGYTMSTIDEKLNEEGFTLIKKDANADRDEVNYFIASKDEVQNGTTKKIIFVGCIGSHKKQWYSNFDPSATKRDKSADRGGAPYASSSTKAHLGFADAQEYVYYNLSNYIKELNRNGVSSENIKVFLTGHSRGAATANLLAARLVDEQNLSNALVKAGNIYAYTFATPRPTTEENSSKYNCIFNIVNPEDFVTKVMLKKWGYNRYGITYSLPSKTNDKNWKNYLSAMRVYYKDYKGYEYEPYLNGEKATYNIISKMKKNVKSPSQLYTEKFNATWYRGWEIKLTNKWTTFCFFKKTLLPFVAKEEVDWGTLADVALGPGIFFKSILFYFAWPDADMPKNISWEEMTRLLKETFGNKFREAHEAETYYAYMHALTEGQLTETRKGYKGTVNCPVDIEIYDKETGELVGRIVNNTIDEEVAGKENSVVMSVDGDSKEYWLPSNGSYTVKLMGNDNGTMDYTVSEIDSDIGETARINFYDVEIIDGCTFTSEVIAEEMVLDEYTLTSESGEILESDEMILDDLQDIKIDIQVDGSGVATESMTVTKGDYVTVSAQANSNSIFAGWYEGDVCVSTDETYSFVAKTDKTIISRFKEVNPLTVEIPDSISMNYKDSTTITPTINADEVLKYTVSYSSSNDSVVSVDQNGNIATRDKGSATITVTVTDEYGNTVSDTCDVEVKYTWWQWIIVIVLFGWIWY